LTTNNSLLNKEVQKGTYDDVIPRAARMLQDLDPDQRLVELAFILNAIHGLKLVEQFGAFVSVEEHTDLAHDYKASVETARRFWKICPERFNIKLPHTPAGILATRTLINEGIRVNHTLGFSARQNYMTARIARPTYVNVFLGRLNSFVADNDLGDGAYIGERTTLASQRAIRELRHQLHLSTRQIGASYREGQQVIDLAGIDVMTMPPKVAKQFLELTGGGSAEMSNRTEEDYKPPLNDGVEIHEVGLDTLWDVEPTVVEACDALDKEDLDTFSPDDLVDFLADHGVKDLLVRWSDDQVATSAREGKIPSLDNWSDSLSEGEIGLDALMNLAGLNAFRADQEAMDDRVAEQLAR
jgi:transaldolase